ncbi:MAG: endo-1,4-beta-xylanase [Candidatus Binataceae bacterium]
MAKRSRFTAAWIALGVALGVLAALLYSFRTREALFWNGFSIARVPHASIEMVAFDQNGHRLSSIDFFRTWRPTLIVRDHNDAVCLGLQYGLGPPRIAIPAAEPVSIELMWPVSGFGKVLLTADNAGRGYRVSAGAYTRIELIPELARSRLAEVERWISHHNQGHPVADEVTQALALAHQQLKRVDAAKDPKERAAIAIPALRAALQAGEREVLAEASGAISEHRTGSLLIKVIDPHGTQVREAKIRVTETRPEFLFGAGIQGHEYKAETVARLKQLGLSYASLDLSWSAIEPRSQVYAFDRFDRRFNLAGLKEDGFVIRARGLITASEGDLPSFVAPMRGNADALRKAIPAQIAPIIKHYKDIVDVWQIEQDRAAWAGLGLDDAGTASIIKAVTAEIRKTAPDARIMINVAAPLGEDAAAQYNRRLLGIRESTATGTRDPYTWMKYLSSAGVDYDLIGLEFCCGASRDHADSRVPPPTIDLMRFARELERWSNFGKPLQITALDVGSRGGGVGWWHAFPDEATQADYLTGAVTIAYADPKVEAFNWAALFDSDAVIAGGGLIDRAKRPKPAYDRLSALLNGWRSGGDVTTNSDGIANFQGAPGDYRLSAKVESDLIAGAAHIHAGTSNVAIMSITAIVPLPPLPPLAGLAPPGGETQPSPDLPEPFVLEPPPMEQPLEPPGP